MAANENTCDKRCNQICPDPHIRKRVGDKRILESLDQFCAGFYHTYIWYKRNCNCLDAQNCIIARKAKQSIRKAEEIAQKAEEFATKAEKFSKKEKLSVEDANKFAMEAENFAKEADEFAKDANKCGDDLKTFAFEVKELVLKAKTFAKRFDSFEAEESIKEPNAIAWEVEEAARQTRRSAKNASAQPKTEVAVVKFESVSGKILYEARYTNCSSQKMHADNFFKEDIVDKDGEFRELVQDNPKGTITLYLTQFQPCNKSTRLEGASGIMTDQSSCDILKEIVTGILQVDDQEIKLCVKVAHTNRLELEEPAKGGIKELMEEGVNISGMTQDDWDYLFSLTKENGDRKDVAKYNKDRKDLDQEGG